VPSPSTLKSCSGLRQNYTPPMRPPWRKKEQCARDKAEAIAAAVSARAKRGAAGDDKLDLKDLKAVVKVTHIVLGKTGFSKFNTKVLCLQFLAAVSPAWDTLLPAVSESGAPAPPAAAPAPVVPVVFLTPPATTPRPSIDHETGHISQ